ncbi:hypothetical protein [Acidianus sp. HS-5]|uniref:hypothetical protein n=1 Tax=Acidianus sp. HS-5 TaxID=2886040 RepID=UPI001F2A3B09|nr:hypothetical protein [Acidianus sp. HS-5]BDC18748.1 hypothetical protein HS5_16380 [Acidianus sp. HS-5]
MLKTINYNDGIVINFDDFTNSKRPIPLYVASDEGIYRVVNSVEVWKDVKKAARPWFYAMVFSFVIILIIIIIVLTAFSSNSVFYRVHYPLFGHILLALLLIMIATELFLSTMALGARSRVLKSSNLIGELIVPWNEICYIEYHETWKYEYEYDTLVVDWIIHTRSGDVITIQRVKSPDVIYNKILHKFYPNLRKELK